MAKAKKKGAPNKGTPKQPASGDSRIVLVAAVLNFVTALISIAVKVVELFNK